MSKQTTFRIVIGWGVLLITLMYGRVQAATPTSLNVPPLPQAQKAAPTPQPKITKVQPSIQVFNNSIIPYEPMDTFSNKRPIPAISISIRAPSDALQKFGAPGGRINVVIDGQQLSQDEANSSEAFPIPLSPGLHTVHVDYSGDEHYSSTSLDTQIYVTAGMSAQEKLMLQCLGLPAIFVAILVMLVLLVRELRRKADKQE